MTSAPGKAGAGQSASPAGGGNAFSWRFTAPLYMGSALNPINSSLIATALVPIAAAVHISAGRTAVLVTALYLASSIAQPTCGKLSEEFGPRRVFLAGILTVLAGGVVLAVGLAGWELRARHPFLDVRLLASNMALTRTYLRFALITLCIYTVLYGITQWLEAGRGISAEEAGLLLLPLTALSAVLVRPISQRNLVRGPLIVAAGSSLVASIGVLFLSTSTAIISIVAITLIFGITLGTTASGNQTALYTQATADQIGTASGLFRTFGYIGSIASSAIISIAFHKSVTDHGLHIIAVIMIAVSAVTLLMTLADRRLRTPGPAATAGSRMSPDAPSDTSAGT
jgi:predicted MFS family arabinose efflux permease